MKLLKSLLIILIFVISSCNSVEKKNTAKDSSTNTPETTVVELPDSFYKKLKGTIGGTIAITMDLYRSNSTLTGSYYYDKNGYPLNISGNIKTLSNIKITETDDNNQVTGYFTGAFTNAKTLEGTWTNPKTNKSLPFKLTEITDGIAAISFEKFHKENCSKAEVFKSNPSKITSYCDTICSKIDLELIKVSASNPNVSSSINKSIMNVIINDFGYFISKDKKITSIDDLLNSVIEDDEEDYLSATICDVICNLQTNDNEIISIAIYQNSENCGDVHPNHDRRYCNFDLKTGKKITLAEILYPNYFEMLKRVAETKFAEQWGKEVEFEATSLNLNDNFGIEKSGLYFQYFGIYIGQFGVLIPYKDIDDLIRRDGLLTRLYKPNPQSTTYLGIGQKSNDKSYETNTQVQVVKPAVEKPSTIDNQTALKIASKTYSWNEDGNYASLAFQYDNDPSSGTMVLSGSIFTLELIFEGDRSAIDVAVNPNGSCTFYYKYEIRGTYIHLTFNKSTCGYEAMNRMLPYYESRNCITASTGQGEMNFKP